MTAIWDDVACLLTNELEAPKTNCYGEEEQALFTPRVVGLMNQAKMCWAEAVFGKHELPISLAVRLIANGQKPTRNDYFFKKWDRTQTLCPICPKVGTFVDCRVHHSVEWEKVYLTITLKQLLAVIPLVVVGLCLSALFLWRLINNALAMANLGRFIWILCNFLGLVLFYFHYLFYREYLDTLGTLVFFTTVPSFIIYILGFMSCKPQGSMGGQTVSTL